MDFFKPPKLKKNEEIRIISTARFMLKSEVVFAEKILTGWGFRVTYGQHLFDQHHQFAGNNEQRMVDLQEAIDDVHVKAILFARGGYGTVKIIDGIDFSPLLEHPKWLIGFSDITVIHSHIHRHISSATIHASMPISFEKNTAEARSSIQQCLLHGSAEIKAPASSYNRSGTAKGSVIGGNLSILYSLMGSASQIDTQGKILFIEDLDEYLYHIDRMMMNLLRSGMLHNLAGLIVGGFSDMHDNKIPYGQDAYEIISEAVSAFSYPVAFDFPAGHIDDNRAMMFGVESTLTVLAQETILHQ